MDARRRGYDTTQLSRDQASIARAVAALQADYGVRDFGIPTELADFDAVDATASRRARHALRTCSGLAAFC
ncbi:protein of unknown function [Paraburkholderia dioscoreae]|uniref:Uncharacterized protein n=1 Tax=Paraburkholderia dioscoreae TaxID=2604047 RepID=A0A5Q4ZCX5_9BURK|nr:protein of unknown function [Paraburkholderia dioscoreae]